MKHRIIPIFIPHLGCPFNCIFCDQNRITSQYQVPSAADVIDTIDEYLATFPRGSNKVEVAFYGGSFTAVDKKEQDKYLRAVSSYLNTAEISNIRISTRPDCIDCDTLRFLKERGVGTIELGVQSLDDGVLRECRRGYTQEDVVRACRLVREENFKLGIQLMIGLPGDSYTTAMETTAKVISLKPDMVRIYPTLIIKGTFLESMFRDGSYASLDLQDAIRISRDMFLQFQRAKIKVIRMGLQPSEELCNPDTVVAGPFHPSFGELVEQEVFKDQACQAIEAFFGSGSFFRELKIFVHKKDISKMVGYKRCNIYYLCDRFTLKNVSVHACESVERDCVGIGNNAASVPEKVLTRREFCSKGDYYSCK